jgi:hypothetical protein
VDTVDPFRYFLSSSEERNKRRELYERESMKEATAHKNLLKVFDGTSFHDPKVGGANVAPVSQVCTFAMFLLRLWEIIQSTALVSPLMA